ncbi:hypothetical protein TWF481_002764 [Arthrobotrys musiformis]|uniref:Uncharacterized protein n=1 Tax=Arthrobotrys musiformis TaxID=47236 RepID=A0AAV9VR63_9PEZI
METNNSECQIHASQLVLLQEKKEKFDEIIETITAGVKAIETKDLDCEINGILDDLSGGVRRFIHFLAAAAPSLMCCCETEDKTLARTYFKHRTSLAPAMNGAYAALLRRFRERYKILDPSIQDSEISKGLKINLHDLDDDLEGSRLCANRFEELVHNATGANPPKDNILSLDNSQQR